MNKFNKKNILLIIYGCCLIIYAIGKFVYELNFSVPTEQFVYCSRDSEKCKFSDKFLAGNFDYEFVNIMDIEDVDVDVEAKLHKFSNKKLNRYDIKYNISVKLKGDKDPFIFHIKENDEEKIRYIVKNFKNFLNNPEQKEFRGSIESYDIYILAMIFLFILWLKMSAQEERQKNNHEN